MKIKNFFESKQLRHLEQLEKYVSCIIAKSIVKLDIQLITDPFSSG
jgi:hypothetical protein